MSQVWHSPNLSHHKQLIYWSHLPVADRSDCLWEAHWIRFQSGSCFVAERWFCWYSKQSVILKKIKLFRINWEWKLLITEIDICDTMKTIEEGCSCHQLQWEKVMKLVMILYMCCLVLVSFSHGIMGKTTAYVFIWYWTFLKRFM